MTSAPNERSAANTSIPNSKSGWYAIRLCAPPLCRWTGCVRKATHDVYNNYNAHVSPYCRAHAIERLKVSES